MDVFHVNEGSKSYVYPTIKILICLALIIAFINRDHIIHIDNRFIDVVVRILCTAMVFACIFCIEISVAEFFFVHENRTKDNVLFDSTIAGSKKYTIDEIVSMAESNDIIEIQIVFQKKTVLIGSSSDCKNGSSKFFDKLYYIGDETFKEITSFKSALLANAVDGQLLVNSIDGMTLK